MRNGAIFYLRAFILYLASGGKSIFKDLNGYSFQAIQGGFKIRKELIFERKKKNYLGTILLHKQKRKIPLREYGVFSLFSIIEMWLRNKSHRKEPATKDFSRSSRILWFSPSECYHSGYLMAPNTPSLILSFSSMEIRWERLGCTGRQRRRNQWRGKDDDWEGPTDRTLRKDRSRACEQD